MFVVPGFVTAEQVGELLAANAAHAGPRRGTGTPSTDCPLRNIVPAWVVDLLVKGVRMQLYPLIAPLEPDYVAYTVLGVGASHPLHADAVIDERGTPNHTPHRIASAMLYLGTEGEQFAGGSIRFPGCGVTVKPLAGTLVGFLTDWKHRHEVFKVTRGERHALALWFKMAD